MVYVFKRNLYKKSKNLSHFTLRLHLAYLYITLNFVEREILGNNCVNHQNGRLIKLLIMICSPSSMKRGISLKININWGRKYKRNQCPKRTTICTIRLTSSRHAQEAATWHCSTHTCTHINNIVFVSFSIVSLNKYESIVPS